MSEKPDEKQEDTALESSHLVEDEISKIEDILPEDQFSIEEHFEEHATHFL